MSGYEVWPAQRHTRMRWANGGGWTTEIVAEPSGPQWEWRMSVADVEAAGPFSLFPGVDRSIALISGAGFALTVNGGDEVIIDAPYEPFDFAGDATTSCRLIDGPVRDINLMSSRRAVARRLEFLHVPPHTVIEISHVDVAVLVAGHLRIEHEDLGYLDTIRCASESSCIELRSGPDGAVVATANARVHG